jgi:hypothetical protein
MESTGARLILYPHANPEFRIWGVGDIHWGDKACAKDFLAKDIASIADDPYSLWSLLGDYCSWITPDDKRFDAESVDESVKVRDLANLGAKFGDKIIELLAPIKGKCLAAGLGNHDLKYFTKAAQVCVHEHICKHLGVRNARYSGWYDLWFERRKGIKRPILVTVEKASSVGRSGQTRLRCFQHHGAGAAGTSAGKLAIALRLANMVIADLVMMGHVHEQIAKPLVRLDNNATCTELTQYVTGVMVSGSYLKTYESGMTGYGEVKAYSPTTLGATSARYWPCQRKLIVESRADGVGMIMP